MEPEDEIRLSYFVLLRLLFVRESDLKIFMRSSTAPQIVSFFPRWLLSSFLALNPQKYQLSSFLFVGWPKPFHISPRLSAAPHRTVRPVLKIFF
jgi:hypothetical protein